MVLSGRSVSNVTKSVSSVNSESISKTSQVIWAKVGEYVNRRTDKKAIACFKVISF